MLHSYLLRAALHRISLVIFTASVTVLSGFCQIFCEIEISIRKKFVNKLCAVKYRSGFAFCLIVRQKVRGGMEVSSIRDVNFSLEAKCKVKNI